MIMYPIYPDILNHNILILDSGPGWTKTHGYFIQMGGFMLFEGDNPKGVMTPEIFSQLLKKKKIEFPNITVEEIEDRSKSDARCRRCLRRNTLHRMVLQFSLQCRSYAVAGLFGGSYCCCLSITYNRLLNWLTIYRSRIFWYCYFCNLHTSICSFSSSIDSRGFHLS